MRADVKELNPSKILRTVPLDQSFFFFEGIGEYTGRSARNLNEFFEIINQIDMKSVTFHFRRGDFDKWIREGLNDVKLARSLKRIKKSACGEELRNKVSRAVRRRMNELDEMLLLLETPPTLTC
jgi:hypothetical protein